MEEDWERARVRMQEGLGGAQRCVLLEVKEA